MNTIDQCSVTQSTVVFLTIPFKDKAPLKLGQLFSFDGITQETKSLAERYNIRFAIFSYTNKKNQKVFAEGEVFTNIPNQNCTDVTLMFVSLDRDYVQVVQKFVNDIKEFFE